ncbi:MAG: hypothetical protein JETCAE03_35980 [Ignavibacteriaceae bacterium]|jgi:hypothetical protein|nr:MAG: hypothetical protein JETCAE03_35980 [Ignavibacteriaceae bacterium]
MTRTTELVEKTPEERLKVYNMILSSCTHLYSKNQLQEAKFKEAAELFTKLAKEDPMFMVHFTAWASKRDSKDLQILSIFFNALNDADGGPFFKGSNKNKPNFRSTSAALLQNLSPHLALRLLELTRFKFGVKGYLSDGAHYPSFLKNAFRKYILYRENNPDMVRGAKRAGLGPKLIKMYKMLHMAPTPETAGILGWKQKDKDIIVEKIDFDKMKPAEIAKYIEDNKLSPLVALSALPEGAMNAKIAKALLKNCTGNQAIILQNMFRRKGFLEIAEIKELFDAKVTTAKTAVDRIDTLSKDLTDTEKKEMTKVRSKVRKEIVGKIGKVFMHIDKSGSMSGAIEFAKDKGAIFAECVSEPEVNFAWGVFGTKGKTLNNPQGFTKEDFHAALYGITANDGSTDCLGCYKAARNFGADIDVYVTDQGHNVGDLTSRLRKLIDEVGKPSAAIIIDFSNGRDNSLKRGLESVDIPVSVIKPNALSESALVAQAVKQAIKGQMAVIDEVMDTELPKLPKWYFDKTLEDDYKKRLNG